MTNDLYALLIAGGAGTRLWPLSRGSTPKQLLALSGGQHSLMQHAFRRLARAVVPEHIHTVTSQAYDRAVLAQLRAIEPDYAPENVLAEPMGRDSAAAVLWGALRIDHLAPDAVAAVVWSDQKIGKEAAFDAALAQAYQAVRDGGLAAIGVRATTPSTKLGCIKLGTESSAGVYHADQFIEKPDYDTAQRFVAEGCYLWNPGVFVFKVQTLLEEFARHAPTMLDVFRKHARSQASCDWLDVDLITEIYAELPRISIDHLLLEKTDRLSLLAADLDWSDLGTWDELYLQAEKDADGNAKTGNVVTVDTQNTYIHGSKRLIAALGVEDLIIVDTEDALLICDLARVQDVKHLVAQLKERGFGEVVEGFGENVRPWGSYAVLAEGTGYKVKCLEILPHQKLSLQLHEQRAEHWVVVEGQARLTRGEQTRDYQPSEYLYIPKDTKHRIENATDEVVRIIEVQRGDYLGEDDIVRFEDVYGRA